MNGEAAVGHILYVEQRAETWIIKLSCELITPSKRPGCSQEARKTLRKMTLISSFCQWNPSLFPGTDGPGPLSNGYPHRLNHFGASQSNVITLLCLTGKTHCGWISHQFRQSDFHPTPTPTPTPDQIWYCYCASTQGLITRGMYNWGKHGFLLLLQPGQLSKVSNTRQYK